MNRQLHYCRQGYRAEKLGEYLLSDFAAITSVARPDDFGIDCYCALLSQKALCDYVGKIFGVQIKSGKGAKLVIGGSRSNKPGREAWKEHEVHWLLHLNIPFFLAIVHQPTGTLRLYSTSRIWWLRWLIGRPYKIILKPGKDPNPKVDFQSREWFDSVEKTNHCEDIHDGREWVVPLGKPIIEVSKNTNNSHSVTEEIRKVINWWVSLEQENQLYQSLSIPFCWECKAWETNTLPGEQARVPLYFGNPTKGQNIDTILKALQSGIIALAYNFLLQEDARISSLKEIINLSKNEKFDTALLEQWIQKAQQKNCN